MSIATHKNRASTAARSLCAAALAAASVFAFTAPSSHANWLTRIVGEAGEAGAKAAKKTATGTPSLDDAASLVKTMPASDGAAHLAAHITPEGHWRFVNRDGEIFTAATPEELSRAVSTLAPQAADGKLSVYLTDASVFERNAQLRDLPGDAELHLVLGDKSYRLSDRDGHLIAELRPGVATAITNAADFSEIAWRMSRPLEKSAVRIVALEPGASPSLAPRPRFDPTTQGALVDVVDPDGFAASIGAARGQTLLLTGRIDGDRLFVRPRTGDERSLVLADLRRAAAAADVDLVVLQSSAPRQPGGRNWFWQTVGVTRLNDALRKTTFADFLDVLGGKGGGLEVALTRRTDGRVVLTATPADTGGTIATDLFGEWFDDIVSGVTGDVVMSALEADVKSRDRQIELDARIVPFSPSLWQFAYLGSLVAGLMGLSVVREWWRGIWPLEARADYGSAAGYWFARGARLAAMLVAFMPLAGLPALIVATACWIWGWITLPARAWRWLTSKTRTAPAGEDASRVRPV